MMEGLNGEVRKKEKGGSNVRRFKMREKTDYLSPLLGSGRNFNT